ncbi:MAB_1171c family putative transporter [Amycolatopsis sp. NPDC004079]|uniref:MAB_1171c family putative transporter n=1 Tax=Amycolatopsis sp. NPDC004079 TaxID=3154549 RepID=UPI0033B05B37
MITQLCVLVGMVLAALPRLYTSVLGGRRCRSRLILGVGLLMLAAGQLFSIPPITHRIDLAFAGGAGKVAYNVASSTGLFLLVYFFWRADGPARRSRFPLMHSGFFVVAAGAFVGLMIATPEALRQHTLQSPFMHVPQIVSFYLVGNVFFVYSYIVAGWRTWRYLSTRKTAVTSLLRLSLRIVLVATVGLALTSIIRLTSVLYRSLGASSLDLLEWVNWQLSNIAFLLMAVGLSLLAAADIAGAIRTLRHRGQQYRDMSTLWGEMQRAFPEIELEWRRPAERFRRRCIECLDGLARLSPHIATSAGSTDLQRLSVPDLAEHVWAALHRKPELDALVAGRNPVELAIGKDVDPLTEVAAQLAQLSLALRARQKEQAAA